MATKISRILHAGYVFENQGLQIAFDPIFENPFSINGHAFPDVKFHFDKIQKLNFAAVFISHFHDDHCSLESLNLLNRLTPIYVYCVHPEIFDLIRELGFKNVYSLQLNQLIQIGSFQVIARPALDRQVDSLFQVKVGPLNILNVVDSWIDSETLEFLIQENPWDVILWPFQTMREIEVLSPGRFPAATGLIPSEWIDQLKLLNPRILIPSSCQFIQEPWSWFRAAYFPISYSSFTQQLQSILNATDIVKLNPSRSLSVCPKDWKLDASLDWVELTENENVDYNYDRDVIPQTSSEIAKHFSELNDNQKTEVYRFCKETLPKKINELDPFEDLYFQKPRTWRLHLYDHSGMSSTFKYHLNKGQINYVETELFPLGWVTEIPTTKLFNAVFNGESLSSLYIRINDFTFDSNTENEIQFVDILQDPLLCGLFSRHVSSYQHAQLKHLKKLNL